MNAPLDPNQHRRNLQRALNNGADHQNPKLAAKSDQIARQLGYVGIEDLLAKARSEERSFTPSYVEAACRAVTEAADKLRSAESAQRVAEQRANERTAALVELSRLEDVLMEAEETLNGLAGRLAAAEATIVESFIQRPDCPRAESDVAVAFRELELIPHLKRLAPLAIEKIKKQIAANQARVRQFS